MKKFINFLFGEDDKKEEVKVPTPLIHESLDSMPEQQKTINQKPEIQKPEIPKTATQKPTIQKNVNQKPMPQKFSDPKTENRKTVRSPLPELFPDEGDTSFGGIYGEPYWAQPLEGDTSFGQRTWENNNGSSRVKHIDNPKVASHGNSDFYGARDSVKEFGKDTLQTTTKPATKATPKTEYVRPIFEEKKLTIIFVENTTEVAKQIDKLEKIVKSLVTTGFICVINYGTIVQRSEKLDATTFDCSKLLRQNDLGENASMYDAMVVLEDIVKENYNKYTWSQHKRTRINSIEVIGFGRAVDNFSGLSSELGIKCFEGATKNVDIVTKYFCLSDEYFVNAAKIGFRSIGAITRGNT